MKTFLKITCLLLIFFNSVQAIYGGINFILSPDGSGMGLTVQLLENSPFKNFFIPGLILLVSIGLSSLVVITAVLMQLKDYYWYIIVQGFIVMIWIAVQIYMLQTISPLHFIVGSVGLLLCIGGIWLRNLEVHLTKAATPKLV
jgi:hypothetical protein